jgi:hypothetical protein
MSDIDKYSVKPSNYLGMEYEAYKSDLYALAISKPSEYFRLRKNVIQSVKTDAVGNIYTTFKNILSEGKSLNGSPLIQTTDGTQYKPNYMNQDIGIIALKAAKTLDKILDEVIEIILPQNFKALAVERTEKISNENISPL